ncbi:MAG: SxtJ family membrane protein [Phycisphaerales bacterium]
MAVIDVKTNPSRTELRVFAALWLAFFPFVGWFFVPGAPGLLVLALVAAACFAVSFALNADFPRREQRIGAAIPIVLLAWWALGAATRSAGGDVATVHRWCFVLCCAIGVVGAAGVAFVPSLSVRVYRAWMFAVLPIGWSLSHVLLAIVFYLVVTPIGIALRLAGRDPMERRFDRAAKTYWKRREPIVDSERYLRQS